jgi:DNA adenine methylase
MESEGSLYEVADLVGPIQQVTSKPPFGYYGAKQRIAGRIIASLPPHNAWVEAFCGSAAITLAKPPVPIEVINDLDDEVVNIFTQLRTNAEALCKAVALTPYAFEEFHAARYGPKSQDPLERARQFLVATMMTVNSTTSERHSCGFSYSQSFARGGMEARVSRWVNLPARLARIVERLRTVRVEKRDARDLVGMFSDRPATLMYLDPPYFVKRAYGYAIDAKDEKFHRELLEACRRSRAMILISGYRNKLYDAMLTVENGWYQATIDTHTRDTTGKDYARTEVIWRNAQFMRAQQENRVPLRLTRDEIKENKINPSRRKVIKRKVIGGKVVKLEAVRRRTAQGKAIRFKVFKPKIIGRKGSGRKVAKRRAFRRKP